MAQPKRKESPPVGPSVPAPPPQPIPQASYGVSKRGWAILGAVLMLANLPLIHRFFLRGRQPAPYSIPYQDDFSDPSTVDTHYWTTGGYWRVQNGELLSPGVRNNPLWLKAKLPRDVAIDFDVRSESPEGDVKVEIFGDGLDHASGYILIHGGWNNALSIIARLDEHGASARQLQFQAQRLGGDWVSTGVFQRDTHMRVEANPFPVQQGRTYHWHIERSGNEIRWQIDGQPFMSFQDPFPLEGEGHDRFGFSSWDANLFFDNLKIRPLSGS